MDGQYTTSGFQLYGQPLQAPTVQQSGQPLNQPTPAQQVGGFTLIPAPTGAGQPALTSLRNQPVQILQQPTPAAQNKPQQQGGLGAMAFQAQAAQTQPTQQSQQQRLPAAQLQGLTTQQLQYLQAAQQSGQLTAQGFQSYSQPPTQLGAIQILQPKTQPQPQQGGVGRGFQQGQQTLQGMQVLPQQTPQAPQALQPGQNLQGLQQGLQQVPGLQTIPGVQILQQYPGYSQQQQQQQLNAPIPPKQPTVAATGFSSSAQQPIHSAPGTASGHHTGSLFSNSNQRGSYGQGRYAWNNDRERNERTDFRGRPRERGRRDDRGSFGARPPAREAPSRFSREREPFRHDRGSKERYDRGFRDYNRRDRDRKPSPVHHHYDFKKDDARKEPHREVLHKPVHPPVNQEFKTTLPLPLPAKPPPVADYIVKVPQVPFATYERDYSDITRRYTHLYISPDFTKLVCCWAKTPTTIRYPYGCSLCPLNKPVKFEMVQGPYEAEQEIVLPAAHNEEPQAVRWNAKCTFICGLDDKAHEDILRGKFDGGTHVMNALKFVTVREEKDKKKTGIMCLGGPYDPELDGGNPAEDVEGLKRACIRHVKAQTLLDLTPCHSWIRFCDVHYRRLDDDGHECEEVTVIFLIDVSELIPSAEEWPAIWKEQNEWKKRAAQADILPTSTVQNDLPETQENGKDLEKETETEETKKDAEGVQTMHAEDEKMEDVPKEVSLLMKCRTAKNGRVKTMSISLDGLLDYDENDKDEATFELSLMAESFNEMLMRDYGLLILNALMENKSMTTTSTTQIDDKKRPGSILPQETPEPLGKKQKQTESKTEPEATMDHLPEKAEETTAHEGAAEEMEVQYPDSPGDIVHVGDIEAQPESAAKEVPPESANLPSPQPTSDAKQETATVDVVMEEDTDAKNGEQPAVNEELLFAFRYFDRAGCGYLKCDDLRRLLHNLGCCLAPRVVRELVHGAAAMNKEKLDRVCYRSLTDKGTTAPAIND